MRIAFVAKTESGTNRKGRSAKLSALLTAVFAAAISSVFLLMGASCPEAAPRDPAFAAFLEAVWPEAQKEGISRRTYEALTRDLEPDRSLPDLLLAGQSAPSGKGQAEFIQAPADYVAESSIARLAAQGRKLAATHADTLAAIERRYGVPGAVVLAIWGRETGYGSYKLPHDGLRVLATQAYLGRRKEQFRGEFVLALKMLEEGHATRAQMRSSWAGALGLTQFLPSDFYRYAADFDGDGRRDIFGSVPDALASAAAQLVAKGWQRGSAWGYEVAAPANLDCTLSDPDRKRPVRDWVAAGFSLAGGERLSPAALAEPASLFLPAGPYGPAFLVLQNFFVFKGYNFADLYALFVGHLADRISDGGRFHMPWGKVAQLPTRQVEAMQQRLTSLGLYAEKIDGKAGMKTRLALGAYQKANGLKVDCWPTPAVLAHMEGRGR